MQLRSELLEVSMFDGLVIDAVNTGVSELDALNDGDNALAYFASSG